MGSCFAALRAGRGTRSARPSVAPAEWEDAPGARPFAGEQAPCVEPKASAQALAHGR